MGNFDVRQVIERIELQIAKQNMAKEDFYKASNISSASYSQWNTGVHTPTRKKIAAAAETLGVSLEYLLYGEERKENPTVSGEVLSAKEIALAKAKEMSKDDLWELFYEITEMLKK